jgi:hypothetical protein
MAWLRHFSSLDSANPEFTLAKVPETNSVIVILPAFLLTK